MSLKDLKIGLAKVLEAMFQDSNQGDIQNLRHYEEEFGVPYGYLRKIELTNIIKSTTSSKKHRRYKWNESSNMTSNSFNALAERVLNYSPSESTQTEAKQEPTIKTMGFVKGGGDYNAKQVLFDSEKIVDLTLILTNHGVPKEKIPGIVQEILKLKL